MSPFNPQATAGLDAVTTRMWAQAEARPAARAAWRVGETFDDVAARSVRIRLGRPLELTGPALARLAPAGAPAAAPARRTTLVATAVGLVAGLGTDVAVGGPGGIAAAAALTGAGAATGSVLTTAQLLQDSDDETGLRHVAGAVADGLRTGGLLPPGAGTVRLDAAPDGTYRAQLTGVDEGMSELFADALDEVLAPLAAPRYLVSRVSLVRPVLRRDTYRLAVGRLLRRPLPAWESWHAVPAVLAGTRARAEAFAAAWARHLGPSRLLFADSPEGIGVLAACRGDDPFAATTQLRTVWR